MSGWLRPLSINDGRESRRRSRGKGANGVSWRGEEVAWWRTSVATTCARGWIGAFELNAERYALLWILVFGRHPISELGLTTRRWPPSLGLQAVLALLLYIAAYCGDVVDLPPATQLMPLVALALAIGFFQALFWRGCSLGSQSRSVSSRRSCWVPSY
jgi:hypothetical protein